MTPQRANLSGILFMIQASVAFSLMALCVKIASQFLPSLEIVFFRSLIGTLMLAPLMIYKKVDFWGREQERGVLILRGLSGFFALTLHFYVIARLPLGTGVLLNYTSPIFAAMFAMVFLRERPSALVLSTIFLSFFGIYLLVGEKLHRWNLTVVAGLLSAVFAAVATTSIRAVRHQESPLTIIFYFTGISTLGSLFFIPSGFQWPSVKAWLALFGVGIGSFYGQLWLTLALRRAPAALLSPFSYVTPLLSFLYGLIFFHDKMTAPAVVGAFFIILGGSLVTYFETRGVGKDFGTAAGR